MSIFRLKSMILSVFASSLTLFQAIIVNVSFVFIQVLFRSSLPVLPIIYDQKLRFVVNYSKLNEKVFKQRFRPNE